MGMFSWIKSIFGGESEVQEKLTNEEKKKIMDTYKVEPNIIKIQEEPKIVKEPKGINKHPKGINTAPTKAKKVVSVEEKPEKAPTKKAKKTKVKRSWFNNGVKQKLILVGEKPDPGWQKGRLVRKVKKDK